MAGILYGIGVGPGDPELMTLKAVRLIRETEVIALPGKNAKETAAFRIAVQAVPEMEKKTLISVDFPMTRDPEKLKESHRAGAGKIERILDEGRNVAFLTLGDATVYSTFSYVQSIVKKDGYKTEIVSGVPSFCAAAARLGIPLTEGRELLHVIPASYQEEHALEQPENYVLMKSGSRMKEVRKMLKKAAVPDSKVSMVENCGMPGENVFRGLNAMPDDAGYFSIIIVKGQAEENE